MRKITFKKTGTKYDEVKFIVADKVLTKITNPAQGILPHDLLHALVESELGVHGFTDLVFEGQIPNTAMNPDGEAWLSESMVESLQGMLWSGDLDYAQFNEWVLSICGQRKVPAIKISSEQFSKLKKAIEDYSHQWRNLPKGNEMEFLWPDQRC